MLRGSKQVFNNNPYLLRVASKDCSVSHLDIQQLSNKHFVRQLQLKSQSSDCYILTTADIVHYI